MNVTKRQKLPLCFIILECPIKTYSLLTVVIKLVCYQLKTVAHIGFLFSKTMRHVINRNWSSRKSHSG